MPDELSIFDFDEQLLDELDDRIRKDDDLTLLPDLKG